jgi:hypothetical protein
MYDYVITHPGTRFSGNHDLCSRRVILEVVLKLKQFIPLLRLTYIHIFSGRTLTKME